MGDCRFLSRSLSGQLILGLWSLVLGLKIHALDVYLKIEITKQRPKTKDQMPLISS